MLEVAKILMLESAFCVTSELKLLVAFVEYQNLLLQFYNFCEEKTRVRKT